MQTTPTIGINLPLRIVVWVDADDNTWLAYNDPGWIGARHGAQRGNDEVLGRMRQALTAIAQDVTRPQAPA